MPKGKPKLPASPKTKVSLYLNPERSAYLAQWLLQNPSCTSAAEALYLLLDWWAMDAGHKPLAVSNEELSEIRRLMVHSAATQEALAARTTEAIVQLAAAMDRTSPAPALSPSQRAHQPAAKAPFKVEPPRPVHRTLMSWLLDTLTRVSGHNATKVLALLSPLPRTDNSQSQYWVAQLLSVEGVVLSSPTESAIDHAAFHEPIHVKDPIYLVCHKTAVNTWQAQIRIKDAQSKTGRLLLTQDIKH